MKQCNFCGYVDMTDTCQICPQCGNPFTTKTVKHKNGRQRSSGGSGSSGRSGSSGGASWKKIGLFGGIAAGVFGVILAVYFVVTSLFGTNVLGAAAENSIASLVNQLGSNGSLFSHMENMNPFDAKSNRHVLLGVKTPDVYLSLDTDYAGSKKLMSGTIEFQHLQENLDLSLDFNANSKEVRLYAPDLVTDVYGFKYTDLEKKYDRSWIRKTLGLPSADDLNLDPFRKFDLEKYLKEQGGSSWDAFEKSLDIEKYDTRSITLGTRTEECTIYRVQWDAKKAERLLKTLTGKTMVFLPNFIPELATKIAPDVRLYVDSNDNLVGVDFSFLNGIYTFLLEGVSNPWEQVSLKIVTAGGQTTLYTGGVISDASGVRIELKSQNQTVYAIYYNTSNDTFSVVSPKGEVCSGIFRSDDSGFYLESNVYNFSYIFSVTTLDQLPEKADEKYVDLVDPSLNESARLITELTNSLGITKESIAELFN